MKNAKRKYVSRQSKDRWENGSAGKPQRGTANDLGKNKRKYKSPRGVEDPEGPKDA